MPTALRSTWFSLRKHNRDTIVLGTLGILIVLSAVPGLAQTSPATSSSAQATPTGINALFAPLLLTPAPGKTRLANGAPGPEYW